jgi:hypothetical protein
MNESRPNLPAHLVPEADRHAFVAAEIELEALGCNGEHHRYLAALALTGSIEFAAQAAGYKYDSERNVAVHEITDAEYERIQNLESPPLPTREEALQILIEIYGRDS